MANWTVNDLKNKGLIEHNGTYKPVKSLVVKVKSNQKIQNATKVEAYGIIFDSKLEQYMYALLFNSSIEFEHQKIYVVQKSFRYNNIFVREVKSIIDFYLPLHNIIIDTKGFSTDTSKLKFKLLKSYLAHIEDCQPIIEIPKNRKEVELLIGEIIYGKYKI